MKVTIAINNYNYADFIIDCVDSALQQTYKNLEIIVVDDGSTDNSLNLLKLKYQDISAIKIISKSNGGQLSAFNEAAVHMTGDVICFLDADDTYQNTYVSEIANIYKENNDIDFVFCAVERFFINGDKQVIRKYGSNKKLGFSVLSSLYAKEWVGTVTSAVSMRTELCNKILPVPYEGDWTTRADDCLTWGSSIFGANKFYCATPLVLYRVHNNNRFYKKKFSNDYMYKRELSINKLFSFFSNKAGVDFNSINLVNLEYRSRNTKDIKIWLLYFKIIWRSELGLTQKGEKILRLLLDRMKL